jgi:hypothetical protein
MKEATEIASSVETSNGLDTLMLVEGLLKQREKEQEYGCSVAAVDGLLKQLDRTTAYEVLVSEEVDEEVQSR